MNGTNFRRLLEFRSFLPSTPPSSSPLFATNLSEANQALPCHPPLP